MAIQFLSHIPEGFAAELSLLHRSAFPDKQGWKEKDFLDLIKVKFHHLVVAHAGNQLQGLLLYSLILDEAEILTFCVNPAHQRQGIGKKILTVFLAKMKEEQVKTVLLDVAEDNLAAVHLYRHCGFFLNGKRLNYYENKTDALLLSITL